MEELIDLIATDGSASDVSNRVKEILYAKSADRINSLRPNVAMSIFDSNEDSNEDYTEDQE